MIQSHATPQLWGGCPHPPPAVPHVIHLVISLAPGGLERLVIDWTNARNRLHPGSTRICCLDEPGAWAGQVEGNAMICLNAQRSRRPFDLAAVRRLRKLLSCWVAGLSSNHPQGSPASTTQQPGNSTAVLLHSHNAAAWQYGALACSGKGIRHIHTEHGTNPHYRGLINRVRNAWLWRTTDVVVAVANPVAQALAQNQGVPENRILVIPNGISSRDFIEPPKTVGRMSSSAYVPGKTKAGETPAPQLGSVGRQAKVKGYDRLIAAFARLPADFRLLLVGDGPERGALEQQARELGVAARVTFAGFQENPWPYYAKMDLFVLPSRSEGLSISLLEAMSAGIPVAVTDAGDSRVVVDGGRAGIILPEHENEWANLIITSLSDPETAQRSSIARNRVHTHYSQATTLETYERLYTHSPAGTASACSCRSVSGSAKCPTSHFQAAGTAEHSSAATLISPGRDAPDASVCSCRSVSGSAKLANGESRVGQGEP